MNYVKNKFMKEKQKINVLQLVSALQVGGLETLLVDFIKKSDEMAPKDVDFTIVVMNDKVDENLKKELMSVKYKVYFLDRKEGHKHPKYLFQLFNVIKENNIDIIHTHNPGGQYWSVLCKILKPNLKLIYTIHDSIIIKNLNKWGLFINKFFVDMNIAISNIIYEDCLKDGIKKVVKIYNGVDVKKFVPNRIESKNKEIFNIINIARITYYKKGQDILIKALKICKDKGMKFCCNFAGGIYDYDIESFEYLKSLIKHLSLEENIQFLGNCENISELLNKSDLFILPSRYEGLPISLLEAMSANVPVIASNISGSNDLIKHNQNGLLFESENHSDLADKILYLYNNKEKMKCFAENAYKFVQDFDISVMCEKYSELYMNLR